MSMDVDFSTPLTDEERKYLHERGRHGEVLASDERFDLGPDGYNGDGTGPKTLPLQTSEQSAAELQRLRDRIAELEGQQLQSDEDEEDGEPYETWPVVDLDAEIDRRNADGREVKISKSGSKAEKAQRLYADDAAAEGVEQ